MHYLNGREIHVGDWVVGITHNSNGTRCGIVLEILKLPGNCNVRLLCFKPGFVEPDYEGDCVRCWVGENKSQSMIPFREDYADAKKLIRVDDGFAARAVHEPKSAMPNHRIAANLNRVAADLRNLADDADRICLADHAVDQGLFLCGYLVHSCLL